MLRKHCDNLPTCSGPITELSHLLHEDGTAASLECLHMLHVSLRSIPLLDYAAANTAHEVYCCQLLQFCVANSKLYFLNSDPESDLRIFKSKLRLLFLKQSVDFFRISIFGRDWPCLRHSVCVLGIALTLLTAVSFLLDMRICPRCTADHG